MSLERLKCEALYKGPPSVAVDPVVTTAELYTTIQDLKHQIRMLIWAVRSSKLHACGN